MKTNSILQMVVRFTGLIQLVLGIVFWAGRAKSMVNFHIALGSILAIALLILAFHAYRAKVSLWLVILSVVWAFGLPAWGLAQDHILPGSYNWITQVLHVLCGIGAIGLAEMLGARLRKKNA